MIEAISAYTSRILTPSYLRVGLVTLGWYLAITKAWVLLQYGNKPYAAIVAVAGLPESFKYFGLAALVLELFFIVGVWIKSTSRLAIGLLLVLTSFGLMASFYSLYFKLNSDCGCGLFGENEYGLIVQKLVILFLLVLLYKNRERLSF